MYEFHASSIIPSKTIRAKPEAFTRATSCVIGEERIPLNKDVRYALHLS